MEGLTAAVNEDGGITADSSSAGGVSGGGIGDGDAIREGEDFVHNPVYGSREVTNCCSFATTPQACTHMQTKEPCFSLHFLCPSTVFHRQSTNAGHGSMVRVALGGMICVPTEEAFFSTRTWLQIMIDSPCTRFTNPDAGSLYPQCLVIPGRQRARARCNPLGCVYSRNAVCPPYCKSGDTAPSIALAVFAAREATCRWRHIATAKHAPPVVAQSAVPEAMITVHNNSRHPSRDARPLFFLLVVVGVFIDRCETRYTCTHGHS